MTLGAGQILYRTAEPFLLPDQPFEIKGQINNVVRLNPITRFGVGVS
jgi:hypothetical protein